MTQVFSPDPPRRPRVAVLVDGDNLCSAQAGRILIQAGKLGDTLIRRVYGNAAQRTGWNSAPGFAFRHAGTGKNAADLLLAIEAMALVLRQRADALVIASSDRDFTHLATHLREEGVPVLGLGEAKAPEGFRKSCSQFVELAAVVPAEPLSELESKVTALLGASGKEGLRLVELAQRMKADHAVQISDQHQKTWRSWLGARPGLFALDPKGLDARVRLKA